MKSLLLLALLAVGARSALAQSVKLSQIPREVVGRVRNIQVTPDGLGIVYRADQRIAGTSELFHAPLDGRGHARALHAPLSPGRTVHSRFVVSPDATRAVFLADVETAGVSELYSASLRDDEPAVRLNAPLPPGGSVFLFVVDPTSTHVVYSGEQEVDGDMALYSVPLAGGEAPRRVNGPLVPGHSVGSLSPSFFLFSVDGTRVVYPVVEGSAIRKLYSALVDASSAPVELNPALLASSTIRTDVRTAGMHDRIVFVTDAALDEKYELFSAPIDGSAPAIRLHGNVGSETDILSYDVTADGATVVYSADHLVNERLDLFAVPADGGAPPIRLTTSASRPVYFALSPGGDKVAWLKGDPHYTLLWAPVDGSASPAPVPQLVPANGEFWFTPRPDTLLYTGGGALFVTSFAPGGESHRLSPPTSGPADLYAPVFSTERAVFGLEAEFVPGLYSVPLDASGPAQLLSESVAFYAMTPDGSSVVYSGPYLRPTEAHAVRADGALPRRLTPGLATRAAADVIAYEPARSGAHALYLAGDALHAVELAPPFKDRELSRSVTHFSSTEHHVIFRADRAPANHVEQYSLYSVALDVAGDPLRLDPPSADPTTDVNTEFAADPESGLVVFSAGPSFGIQQVFSAPADGMGPVTTLDASASSTIPLQRTIPVQLTPDGTLAVYRTGSAPGQIRSVPVDGSSAPLVLAGGSGIESFRTGSEHVFYLSPLGTRSVRLDGSGAPFVPLALPNAPQQFETSLGVRWLACTSYTPPGYQLELFAGRIDRANSGVAFGPIHESWDFDAGFRADFRFGPQGDMLCFLADRATPELVELYAVPSEGGLERRLSAAMGPDGDVLPGFVVGYERVVYAADALADEQFELFSVPRAGGASTRLVDLASSAQRVRALAFDPSEQWVAYLRGPEFGPGTQLEVVPADGSLAPDRRSGTLVPGGEVTSFRFTLDGRRMLYVASQDEVDGYELYLTPIAGSKPFGHGSRR